jgi:PEP-CTERM motif
MFSRSVIAGLGFVLAAGGANAGSITASTLYFSNAFDYTSDGTQYHQYSPNGSSATESGADPGENVASSVDISTGTLKMLNDGTVTAGFSVNDAAFASLGDTITATGPTAGLSLGVNLQVDGSAQTDVPAEDDTFLVVAAYAPGVFDSNAYSTPLWAEGFGLGTDSGGAAPGQATAGSGLVGVYGITSLTNSYNDGSESIPLNIPFATLPTTFDLFIAMGSYEIGGDITTWDNDYSHTLTVALSAPAGVGLSSASGVFPTTAAAATPEPSTFALVGMAFLAGLALLRKRINA